MDEQAFAVILVAAGLALALALGFKIIQQSALRRTTSLVAALFMAAAMYLLLVPSETCPPTSSSADAVPEPQGDEEDNWAVSFEYAFPPNTWSPANMSTRSSLSIARRRANCPAT